MNVININLDYYGHAVNIMLKARLHEKAWNTKYYPVALQPPSLISARVVVVFVLSDK